MHCWLLYGRGKLVSEDIIKLEYVWKIFGENAQAAMEAIEARNLSKDLVLKEFKCVVGIADCSFSVRKGEVFCVMGLSGSGKSTMVRGLVKNCWARLLETYPDGRHNEQARTFRVDSPEAAGRRPGPARR